MKKPIPLLFLSLFGLIFTSKIFAQAPHITYSPSNNALTAGTSFSLSPANSGGTVGSLAFGTPVQLTGATLSAPGGLGMDASGGIYVTNFGNGTISKFSSSGSYSGTFGTGVSGGMTAPNGIVFDSGGNAYVVDRMTGTNNGRVYKFNSGGAWQSNVKTGINHALGIGIDASNNLYVVDNGTNTVFKYNTSGVAGSPASFTTSLNGPTNAVVDALGNVYVINFTGNNIIKYNPTGNSSYIFASGFSAAYGLAIDALGYIYVGDSNNGQIKVFQPNGTQISTLTTTVTDPEAILPDNKGNVYVASSSANKVYKYALTGYLINNDLPAGLNFDNNTGTISGTPTTASSPVTYTVTAYNASGLSSTSFTLSVAISPPTIAYDTVYAVKSVAITPDLSSNTGGIVPAATYSAVTSVSGGTSTNNPRGLTADGLGNVYEADFGGHVIYMFNSAGTATIIAGTGSAGESDNSSGRSAAFNAPSGIVYDGSGYLYVVDNGGKTVRKVSTTFPYSVTTIESSGSVGTPYGITYDGSAYLYVTDFVGNKIYKVSTSGGTPSAIVTTVLNGPAGIVYDGSGNLYIANSGKNNILEVAATGGTPSVFAGSSSGTSGSTNATSTSASFKTPYGVAFDATGNLLVADEGNDLVRTITIPAAVVTTLAGTTGSAGETNATGTAAKFTNPYAVCTDNNGNAFVGDANGASSTIRQITLTGYTITPSIISALTFSGTTGTIAGTAPAATNTYNYTVTAYNGGGSSTTLATIVVGTAYQWKGNASGHTTQWDWAANWNPNTIPGPNDQAEIGYGSQAFTVNPIIPAGSTITIGSILIGTKVANPSITVNGSGILNVADDITFQMVGTTTTGITATLTSATSGGTINANSLNIKNSQTGNPTAYTLALTSSVTNLNLTGDITTTTSRPGTRNYDASFTAGGTNTTITVDGLQTTNANTNNTSTIAFGGTGTTLLLTGSSPFSGLAATGKNALSLTGVTTIGYTGNNDQSVYSTTAIPNTNPALSSGISYTNITFSGSGIKTPVPTGSLNISGNFTNTLVSDGVSTYTDFSNTTVNFTGTGQTLAGGSGTGTTLYNTVFTGGAKTMSGKFNEDSRSAMTFNGTSATILDAGAGSLTLNSDAHGSAAIASLNPSGTVKGVVNGTVNVQRYLTGGQSYSRGYRLLSSPVSVSSSSLIAPGLTYIKTNAYITGTGGGANGFDAAGNPTLYLYRENLTPNNSSFTSGNYRGVASIGSSTFNIDGDTGGPFTLPAGNGIMLFFRGDKATTINPTTAPYPTALATTLSVTGYLNQGPITVTHWTGTPTAGKLLYTGTGTTGNSAVRGFNLVGNPYPSSIDWDLVSAANADPTTGVNTTIWIYNPTLKTYATYIAGHSGMGTNFNDPSHTNTADIIPSGQGFFVKANSATSVLNFTEAMKSTAQVSSTTVSLATAAANPAAALKYMRIELFKDSLNREEALMFFTPAAKSAFVSAEDAEYLKGNSLLNLSTRSSDNIALAINQMALPQQSQIIPLNVNITSNGIYKLNLTEIKNIPQQFDVWLMDNYIKDSLDIKHNPTYSFNASLADTATYGINRFKLVIRQNPTLLVHLLSFTATKGTNNVKINWSTENEYANTIFVLQRSINDGVSFTTLDSLTSAGLGIYNDLDPSPVKGTNLYRLKMIDMNGNITYSTNVTVLLTSDTPVENNITIYPNPVRTFLFLSIKTNTLFGNAYKITITNSTGLVMKTGTTNLPIWQDDATRLLPGSYYVQVTNTKDNSVVGQSSFIKL